MTVALLGGDAWCGHAGRGPRLARRNTGLSERDRLIFIAFVVIVSTMVVQGLTLPLVVKWLGVIASDDEKNDATQDLIHRARDAGFRRLDELRTDGA